jgi:hypothetical protein
VSLLERWGYRDHAESCPVELGDRCICGAEEHNAKVREAARNATALPPSGGIEKTLRFSPEAVRRLEFIQDRKGSTLAETVRDACRFYEWVLRKQTEGYQLALLKDDTVTEVELLW